MKVAILHVRTHKLKGKDNELSEKADREKMKSYWPMIKLIEDRHEVTHFHDTKSIKKVEDQFDIIWLHSTRYMTSKKTPIVWMPHGNMTFNLEVEAEFIKNHWKELKPKELLRRIGAYFRYSSYVRREKKMLKSADIVMCYCQDNADIFIKHYPKIPKEKYFVVGYGANNEDFIRK